MDLTMATPNRSTFRTGRFVCVDFELERSRESVLATTRMSSIADDETGEIQVNHDFCRACGRMLRADQLKGKRDGKRKICLTCWETINTAGIDRLLEIIAIGHDLDEPDYDGEAVGPDDREHPYIGQTEYEASVLADDSLPF